MDDLTAVYSDVDNARKASIRKHGPFTADPVRASVILGEETGEVMKEALTCTRPRLLPSERTDALASMYEEAAQVAATAINIMLNIREGKSNAYTRETGAAVKPDTNRLQDSVGKLGPRSQRGRAKRR